MITSEFPLFGVSNDVIRLHSAMIMATMMFSCHHKLLIALITVYDNGHLGMITDVNLI